MDLDNCGAFDCRYLRTAAVYNEKLYGHKAQLIGHYVFVFGGLLFGRRPLHIYNLWTNAWTHKLLPGKEYTGGQVDVACLYNDKIYSLISSRRNPMQTIIVTLDTVTQEEFTCVQTNARLPYIPGSAGAFVEERKEMVVWFGGGNAISVLEVDTMKWKRPIIRGIPPMARYNHACCSYRNMLYFSGGMRTVGDQLLDLWILSVNVLSGLCTWSQPTVEPGSYVPPMRNSLTLTCSSPYRVYAIGGNHSRVEFNMFSFRDGKWFDILTEGEMKTMSNYEALERKGKVRGTLYGHAAIQTKEAILIFGGVDTHVTKPLKIVPWV